MKTICVFFAVAAAVFLNCRTAESQLLFIEDVINGNPATADHFINNGLADAFDGYGAAFNFGNLRLHRQVNTIQSLRAYRFVDQFVNESDELIETTVSILGNLGSDAWTVAIEDGPFQSLTFQDRFEPFDSPEGDFDAVIAFTTGNNQFAEDFIFGDVFTNGFTFSCQVSIQPRESLTLMHFATLIKDESSRAKDVEIAEAYSDLLFESPYTVGLTTSQMLAIANFDFTLRGDVNCDGNVDLLDVSGFIEKLISEEFCEKADLNQDGAVNLLDVDWFIFAVTS